MVVRFGFSRTFADQIPQPVSLTRDDCTRRGRCVVAHPGDRGELVLLEAQDRSRWDASQIARGLALVKEALAFLAK